MTDAVLAVQKEWDEKKSYMANLATMGLAFDPNIAVKIPSAKERVVPIVAESARDVQSDSESDESEVDSTPVESEKSRVAEEVERLAKRPRPNCMGLPKSQIKLLTHYINKYGEDYAAMSRDSKNIYQDTPSQIRQKIKVFKSIPAYWDCRERPKPVVVGKGQLPFRRSKKEKTFGKKEVEWITYCLNRYGRNYQAMAKDVRNEFQDSAGDIRREIMRFRRNPTYWDAYKANNVAGVYLVNKAPEIAP